MQWPDLRRAFPWRTGLLMCSIPTLALAALLAWFRGELPPLEGYYLMAYWESSKSAERPENTTQIEWLYKAAPGRQSEPVNRQDVDSNGSGFPPIGLSSSARERGWTRLVSCGPGPLTLRSCRQHATRRNISPRRSAPGATHHVRTRHQHRRPHRGD